MWKAICLRFGIARQNCPIFALRVVRGTQSPEFMSGFGVLRKHGDVLP